MRPKTVLLGVLLGIVIFAATAAGTPEITNASNNQTGSRMYAYPNYGDVINFSVTANESIDTWMWYSDGYDQFNNLPYLQVPFNVFGYHNVSVNGTNINGTTNTTKWVVWTNRETRDTPAEHVDETGYEMLQESIEDEPDFHGMMKAVSYPYTNMLGLIFYLVLFGLPLLMIYIRTDKIQIPATLMFLLGGVIIATLPAQWQIIAGALMGLAMLGMLYSLFKERER